MIRISTWAIPVNKVSNHIWRLQYYGGSVEKYELSHVGVLSIEYIWYLSKTILKFLSLYLMEMIKLSWYSFWFCFELLPPYLVHWISQIPLIWIMLSRCYSYTLSQIAFLSSPHNSMQHSKLLLLLCKFMSPYIDPCRMHSEGKRPINFPHTENQECIEVKEVMNLSKTVHSCIVLLSSLLKLFRNDCALNFGFL